MQLARSPGVRVALAQEKKTARGTPARKNPAATVSARKGCAAGKTAFLRANFKARTLYRKRG